MHRGLLTLALAACAAPPPPAAPPAPRDVYEAEAGLPGRGIDRGPFGRGQAPSIGASLGIAGPSGLRALRSASLFAVPGDGPARALVTGLDEHDVASAELIDVDAGRIRWRVPCAAVGVTADAVICRDADGRALADGAVVAAAGPPVALPDDVVALRGERRLVRVWPGAAAVMGPRGIGAVIALADGPAVLGDRAIVVATGRGVRRFAIPAPFGRRVRAWRASGLAVPAELRDLPPMTDAPAGVAAPVDLPVHTVAIDPADPAALYAAVGGSLARLDLRARAWSWTRDGACEDRATGAVMAIADGLVVCADGDRARATMFEGRPSWDFRAEARVEDLAAAGDVVLVRGADRAWIVDTYTAQPLGALASDDAGPEPAAMVLAGGAVWVIAVEHGRVVARLPRAAMWAAWSRAVDGSVRAITAAGDAVIVELADGDAYRIDAVTGDAVALPGLGQRWTGFGDVLVAATRGGPIPPDLAHWPPLPKPVLLPRAPTPPPRIEVESPPPFATTVWPPPPAMADSFEVTLHDRGGGVRARNDYALAVAPGVMPASARGPAASAIVLTGGDEQLLVVDVVRGDAVSRVRVPRAASAPFATIVDGAPVTGAVVGSPLRLVVF